MHTIYLLFLQVYNNVQVCTFMTLRIIIDELVLAKRYSIFSAMPLIQILQLFLHLNPSETDYTRRTGTSHSH